ncbi:MAG TPA: choice-of-anchor P family protein [Candidatus Nitrosotenuis sp.]
MTIDNKQTHFRLSVASVVVAMIMVTGAVVPAINYAYADATFSGRAMAMSIRSPLGDTAIMDTGSSSEDESNATPITIQTPLGTADGLLSVTTNSDQSESQAALGELVLLPGNPNKITAYFVMAKSQASCSEVSGYSDITSLTMGGKNIQVTGQPNQIVSVPGVLTLTINEQIVDGNSITVNALHLNTVLGADVIVASASSSASCPTTLESLSLNLFQSAFGWGVPSQPGCVDFTTGGGWVKPPPNKGTFGFVAGYKNGGDNPRGNFEYHDHTIDINVHSEDVLYYNCGSFDNSRVFGGHALVNHSSGYCYQVYVQDNGEPGKDTDYFAMWLWSPPTDCPTDGSIPSGTPVYAVGNYLGGGNIQIHAK